MISLPLQLAVRSLGRHGRRTLIVGLGIALGMAAIGVQRGLVAGVRKQMIEEMILSQFGHVAISPEPRAAGGTAGGGGGLIREPGAIDAALAREHPDARTAPSLSALGMAFGDTAATSRVALWGIVPEREPILMRGLRRRMGADPAPLGEGTVYLGSALAERLAATPGGLLTLGVVGPAGAVSAKDFEIAEILGPGAPWQDYFVYLRLPDLQSLMGVGDAVNLVKVYLAGGPGDAGEAAARLEPLLTGGSRQIRVDPWPVKGRLYMGIINAARIQAGLIEFVLLVAAALGVAGAQILTVHERRREIGTMAALGTSRATIRRVFLLEGGVLALAAGILGAAAGMALTLMLAARGVGLEVEAFQWMVGGPRLVPAVDPAAVAWTLLELVVVVTLSGLYPAVRASRLLPIEALRGVPA